MAGGYHAVAFTLSANVKIAGYYEGYFRLSHRRRCSAPFKIVEGATPLQAGDSWKAEAHNSSATNVAKVKGYVYRAGAAVVQVVSSFLCRSFLGLPDHVETIEEPDYMVDLKKDADVGVIQSKGWFAWI